MPCFTAALGAELIVVIAIFLFAMTIVNINDIFGFIP